MSEPAELRHSAEAIAAELPALLVAAERVASTVTQGVHGRRRAGQGETFWQFRGYEWGDPAGTIDWRQSAKSERAFVRETEWEASQSVWLWCDASPSMHYRSGLAEAEKIERARLLLLALAVILVRAGEHIALVGGDAAPASGRAALDCVTRLLTAGATASHAGAAAMPDFLPLPRHAHMVLFGDFLAPLEDIDAMARRYAGRGLHGSMVQVLDPAEETLPFRGRSRFEGLEADGDVLIRRAERVRDAYARRMADHQRGLAAVARSVRWSFTTHRTDRSPESCLLALYHNLSVMPGD